jgi:metal-responsive CopG/Arc/MetJ family transcriptional regulator
VPRERKEKQESNLQRVNIRVSEEVYQYFKKRSEVTGVSSSALMFLALEDYIHQHQAVNTINEIMPYIEMMKQKQ